jgi:hypothetical protein
MVEITRERNVLRFGRVAGKKHMMQVPLRRITGPSNAGAGFRKHNVISFKKFDLFNFPDPARAAIIPEE